MNSLYCCLLPFHVTCKVHACGYTNYANQPPQVICPAHLLQSWYNDANFYGKGYVPLAYALFAVTWGDQTAVSVNEQRHAAPEGLACRPCSVLSRSVAWQHRKHALSRCFCLVRYTSMLRPCLASHASATFRDQIGCMVHVHIAQGALRNAVTTDQPAKLHLC